MSYARSCADAKEEVFRKLIFQKKLERFEEEEHNEKYRQGLVTYTLGINKFAAMTEEEMKAFTHGLVQHAQLSKHRFEIKVWTGETGIITPVKDQRGCGSCRAFSNVSNSCNLQERNEYSGLRLRLILLKSIGNNNWTIFLWYVY
jgi:C1A family cysteine protease